MRKLYEPKIITLLTDFGLEDPYVAMMKGVIMNINPEAKIVDLSHQIEPQNILQAAFLLFHSYRYFPRETIHVAVVDPGVGTERRAILLVTPEGFFLAPDNGLLSYITGSRLRKKAGFQRLASPLQALSLTRKRFWLKEVSQTFHGRDIFAPVAAHLSLGRKPEDMGERIDSLLAFPLPHPRHRAPNEMTGQVMHIDRFGNLITNIPNKGLPGGNITIKAAGHEIKGLASSYEEGQGLLAITGSLGLLEIAYKRGSAADLLGLKMGDEIKLYLG